MQARGFLKGVLQKVLAEMGLSWPNKASVEIPKQKNMGDLATNLCLVLAKEAGTSPKDLAEKLKAKVVSLCPQIREVEVAGPGFMNFFFDLGFWQKTVMNVLRKQDSFGDSDFGQRKWVLLEFVSANPTGPLHIGHGRGAAVGDSLVRILRKTGFQVKAEYYLNDAGRQINLLGKSILARFEQLVGKDAELPQDGYKGDYIIDIAKKLYQEQNRKLLEMKRSEALENCRQVGLEFILKGIKEDLKDFRVDFESWFSESDLISRDQVQEVLNKLEAEELAYIKDGALWFKSTKYGDDKDRVLKKSNGELTYFASDIAYHADKIQRGYELLIDVWGADHHGYIPRMQAAVQALGKDREALQVILIQLVNLMRKGEQVFMSTRAGEFVPLSEVCREVGVDAARFAFLSRKSDSQLDFDLELVKEKNMDNPVYYVQYAHARICSMFKKGEEKGIFLSALSEESLSCLNTSEDLELLKKLDQFPEAVKGAARTLSPHHVSYYLQDLAGLLHKYYNKHQVLNLEDPRLIQARLALVQAVAQVLKNGLQLLGVSAPEKM